MKNGFIPKVLFELAPVDLEADLLYSFTEPGNRFADVVYETYPEISEILKRSGNKADALLGLQEFVNRTSLLHKKELDDALYNIRNNWEAVGDQFLRILSEHMQTGWPADKTIITGYISINPICPRFLQWYSFFVNYNRGVDWARETIAHEILHFLWFKKWKEVFPDSKDSEFESPHLVWRLSEVIDPIILQCYPPIYELIQPKSWGYRSFTGLKIGDTGMTQHFSTVYLKCVKENNDFEKTVRILWDEAQKYKDVLNKF